MIRCFLENAIVEGKVFQAEAELSKGMGYVKNAWGNVRRAGGVLWLEHRVWMRYGRR